YHYPKVHESLKHTIEEHVFLENLPSSFETLSSMKNFDDAFTFGDQFIDDKSPEDEPVKVIMDTEVESIVTVPIHQASSSAPSLSTPIIDLTLPKPVSPPAQESIFTATTATTITTTTMTPLPPLPPPQQSTTDLVLAACVSTIESIYANFNKKHKLQDKTTQSLSSRVFTLDNQDIELLKFNMKEILRDRMFESGSYRSHTGHVAFYDALEVSMDRENKEEFIKATTKSRKRRRDNQNPPPPPPKDSNQSKKKRHDFYASASKQPQAQTSLA
nr:hypothetical protein [Tanacetum cinerariifolium]